MLSIELMIWNREDCGLFDYETNNLSHQKLHLQTGGII